MQPVLLALLRVLSTTVAASCLHAPLSWSPDGQWLAYTVAEPLGLATLKPGWLFTTAVESGGRVEKSLPEPDAPAAAELVRYRIWATERGSMASVMLEDSAYPLSSPAWGPDGHRLLYGRFVPAPAAAGLDRLRGRYEVVMQESLDRKRVILTVPDVEPPVDHQPSISELQAAWSPDGQYAAVPRPGRSPALLIVLSETGRLIKTLDGASHPAWSPDGARLAFIHQVAEEPADQSLQIVGQDFGVGRSLIELSELTESPVWSPDGQSILAAGRRAPSRGREVELLRVLIDSGVSNRVLPLLLQPPENRRGSPLLTLGLDERAGPSAHRSFIGFDREQEFCLFSADIEGQVPVLAYRNLHRQAPLKRFHPLDFSFRLGSLALHPDGQLLAVRVETSPRCGLPLLCDIGSESVTLVAPDADVRQEWLRGLVATAQALLRSALPPPTVDGQRIDRPTLLPVPGEIAEQNPAAIRLRHLGKVGRGLLDEAATETRSAANDEPSSEPTDEHRLLFDYLRGDYSAAQVDLDLLESRATSEDLRFRLLSLRAQTLQAQGQSERSRAIVDYLVKVRGARSRRVEETPLGLVFSPADDPGHLWPRYLALRLSAKPASPASPTGEPLAEEDNAIDLQMPNLIEGVIRREIDAGARIPFPRPGPDVLGPGLPPVLGPGGGRPGGPPFGPERPRRVFPPPAPGSLGPAPPGRSLPSLSSAHRPPGYPEPGPEIQTRTMR